MQRKWKRMAATQRTPRCSAISLISDYAISMELRSLRWKYGILSGSSGVNAAGLICFCSVVCASERQCHKLRQAMSVLSQTSLHWEKAQILNIVCIFGMRHDHIQSG